MRPVKTVLVLGAGGMVGRSLLETAPQGMELLSRDRAGLDIRDHGAVAAELKVLRPDLVINAAGYTAVDAAEDDPDQAFAINGSAVAAVARGCSAVGAGLLHLSTDFVFSGRASRPYAVEDDPSPINVYGASKRDGELCVQEVLGEDALIVRTAWVYAEHGRNFVTEMLDRMRRGEDVKVVMDQVGTPTWARGLAGALWRMVDRSMTGLQHWTPAGVASWYDLAVAVQEGALARGLISAPVRVRPIRSRDHATRASRPAYSVLDKTSTWRALGGAAEHWRSDLEAMLDRLADERDGPPSA